MAAEELLTQSMHLITKVRSNICKRTVIEMITAQLKNICRIAHACHRSPLDILANLLDALLDTVVFTMVLLEVEIPW